MRQFIVRRFGGPFNVALQVVGVAMMAYGLWLVFPPAGVIAAGLGLFALGVVRDNGT